MSAIFLQCATLHHRCLSTPCDSFQCGSCFSLMTPILHTSLYPCHPAVPSNSSGKRFSTPEFCCDLIWQTERNRNATVRVPSLGFKRSWRTLYVSTSLMCFCHGHKRSQSPKPGSCLVLGGEKEICGTKPHQPTDT